MEIPCFADSVKRCDKYIRSIGYDIFDILTNPDPEVLEQKPLISFLAITTMHVSEINYNTVQGFYIFQNILSLFELFTDTVGLQFVWFFFL